MTDIIKKSKKNPHTIILEGFAEIEKLKSVQVKYIKKKGRYQELLENDENVTEIDTKHFRELMDTIDTLWATLPLMIQNYESALEVIDMNKEDVTNIAEEANKLSKDYAIAEKKLLEIEAKIFERGEEARRLSEVITFKIKTMNQIYTNEAGKPVEDDYLKMTREMRIGIIEVITKNVSNKRIPYDFAVLKFPHISKKYIDSLYLTLYKMLFEEHQMNKKAESIGVIASG